MPGETLASDLAEKLLCALPEELDEQILDLLRELANHSQDPCVFLVHLQGESEHSLLIDLERGLSERDRFPRGAFGEWLPQLHLLTPIVVKDTAADGMYSKPTERMIRQRMFKSLLIVPLSSRGFAVGFLVLAARRTRPVWEETLQRELTRIAEILGNVLDRQFMERQLGRAVRSRREIRRRAVDLQEKERRFLAQELHDQIGQILTAIKTEAALICSPRTDAEGVQRWARSIQQHVDSIYESIHVLINRLRSSVLDELGLTGALKSCVMDSAAATDGVKTNLETSGDFANLDDVVQMTLYRVLQECMTNIARHAAATEVKVALVRELTTVDERRSRYRFGEMPDGHTGLHQDRIRLTVVDNGVGFEPGGQAWGVGLTGMLERLKSVGGTLDIHSAPNEGTRVEAIINLSVVAEPALMENMQ